MARFSSSTKIIQCRCPSFLSFFFFFLVIILSPYAWSLFVERSFMHFFTHLFPSIAFCASASISKLYYTPFQGGCFYTNLAWWIRLFLSKWWKLIPPHLTGWPHPCWWSWHWWKDTGYTLFIAIVVSLNFIKYKLLLFS